MSKKAIGVIVSCILVVALIVVLARPGVEPEQAIVDRAEGITTVSGAVDFSVSMADKDEAQVQVLVEDEFTGQPVEGIAVELVVTATTLEVLLHDPQGDYLPGVFVFEQDKLDHYSEIRTENPIIITLLTITVAVLKTWGLVKFVAGGVTIMAGGTVPLVKFALSTFVTSLVAGGLWAVTQHMASSASPEDTVSYPITIYVFEEPGSDYATDTIKVQAGTTWEEIDDAVRGITGDIEVEVVWPTENPAGAYYHPDGTPKVLYVYPLAPEESAPEETESEELAPGIAAGLILITHEGIHRVINLDGEILFDMIEEARTPIWSPDGERLAYEYVYEKTIAPGVSIVTERGISVIGCDGTMLAETVPQGKDLISWSPDGKKVLYRSHGEGTGFAYQRGPLTVFDVYSEERIELERGSNPRWSPDGTKLAYINEYDNLVIVDSDGTGETRLVPDVRGLLEWSPDGKVIAYTPTGYEPALLIHVDTKSRSELTGKHGEAVRWAPIGNKVAFMELGDLVVAYVTDAGEVEEVVPVHQKFAVHVSRYYWSPDGERILYSTWGSGRPEDFGYFIANIGTGGTYHFGRDKSNAMTTPRWAPDGKRLVFTMDDDVCVINADGTGEIKVGEGTDPSWSPDWTRIAYQFTDRFGKEVFGEYIYVVNPDGTGNTRLTEGTRPIWASSG